MRARDSGRLLALASSFVSHQLKPSPSSEAVCVHVYASVLRRPYTAFAGGVQVMVACAMPMDSCTQLVYHVVLQASLHTGFACVYRLTTLKL